MVGVDDPPRDQYPGDPPEPGDEARELPDDDDLNDDPVEDPVEDMDDPAPLSLDEREDVLADLEDLDVFRALLEPRGVRGLVVDCQDCALPHYFGWDLLHGNLRQLLDEGSMRVHEPAYDPDPADYVSWDYARGFADGVLEAADDDS